MGKIALVDTEEGFASVSNLVASGDVDLYPARTYDEADKAFEAISKRQAEYDRVVIDTVTTLATTCNQELSLRGGARTGLWAKRDSLRITEGQWGQMSSMIILLTRNFYDLKDKKIVLICHEGSRENPFDGVEMHAPDLNRMILKDVYGYADAVVRLGKLPQAGDINGTKYAAGTRILRLQDSAQYMAKGRDTLPYARPDLLPDPTFSKFMEVCKPEPRKIVIYGPPGSGKTVLACSK